jgi:hypothetical protein
VAEKVKLSKDGHSIDFVQTDNIPTSMKKFRHSPEIEGFYRFIYENDLQKEAFEILEKIVNQRKVAKKNLKIEAAQTKKLEQNQAKEQKNAKSADLKNKKDEPKKGAAVVAKTVSKDKHDSKKTLLKNKKK